MPVVEKRVITPRAQTVKREKPKTREELLIDSLSPTLSIMVKAVRKAGRRMVRDFGEVANLQVSRKGPGNFVSNADLAAEKLLIEQLSADRPDYGFISEESGTIPARNNSPFTWVIDPIDGTTNFLHAVPYFAVSVSLLRNDSVIAAVTFNPITNDLYYAEKGKGAYLMTSGGNMRLRVSGRTKFDETMVGCNGFGNERTLQKVQAITNAGSTVRYTGCMTLSLAAVAAGQFDAHVSSKFSIWDVAAGYLLVKEAGGFVADFDGGRELSDIVKSESVLATSAGVKEPFLKLCQK